MTGHSRHGNRVQRPRGGLRRAAVVLSLSLGACAAVHAQAPEPAVFSSDTWLSGPRPTFQRPHRLRLRDASRVRPAWTHAGLRVTPPVLPKDEGYGFPIYDPESRSWYATAQGVLVRLEPDGSRIVVLEGMRAIDVDVRAKRRLAVSREPDDTIVLHDWTAREHRRTVLLSGHQFFNPRFSPDGSRILVTESRAEGGRIWMVSRDGAPVDLGQGYGASWHPDGARIVFTRIAHDRHTILSSDVYLLDLATRRESKLAHTETPVALEPVVSLDGKWIAFTDQKKRDAFVVEVPATAADAR